MKTEQAPNPGTDSRLVNVMANSVPWDVNKYKSEFESEEHWQFKKRFMDTHMNKFPEDKLVCLSRLFFNIEYLGCRYPEETMKLIAELSKGIVDEHREKRKRKLKRTFVETFKDAEADSKDSDIQISEEPPNKTVKTNQEGYCSTHINFTKPLPQPPMSGPFPGLILFETCTNTGQLLTCPITILLQSVKKNKIWNTITFSNLGSECEIKINNKLLVSKGGSSEKDAKLKAAIKGLRILRKTCYTIQCKNAYLSYDPYIRKSDTFVEPENQLSKENSRSEIMQQKGCPESGLGKSQQGIQDSIKNEPGSEDDDLFGSDSEKDPETDTKDCKNTSVTKLRKDNSCLLCCKLRLITGEETDDDIFDHMWYAGSEVMDLEDINEHSIQKIEESDGKVTGLCDMDVSVEAQRDMPKTLQESGENPGDLISPLSEESRKHNPATLQMTPKTPVKGGSNNDQVKEQTSAGDNNKCLNPVIHLEKTAQQESNQSGMEHNTENSVSSNDEIISAGVSHNICLNPVIHSENKTVQQESFQSSVELNTDNSILSDNETPLKINGKEPALKMLKIFLPDGSYKRIPFSEMLVNKVLKKLINYSDEKVYSYRYFATVVDLRTNAELRELFSDFLFPWVPAQAQLENSQEQNKIQSVFEEITTSNYQKSSFQVYRNTEPQKSASSQQSNKSVGLGKKQERKRKNQRQIFLPDGSFKWVNLNAIESYAKLKEICINNKNLTNQDFVCDKSLRQIFPEYWNKIKCYF